jgi:chromosome segregation ATPase
MNSWFELILVNALTLATGFLGGGYFAKKKARAEAEGSEVDNLKDIIITWREAYNDLKIQREEFNTLWLAVQKENITMRHEILSLDEKVKNLQCDNGKLKKEIEKLKNYDNSTI